MTKPFHITFAEISDLSVATMARGLDAYTGFTANVIYPSHVLPFCPNPVVLSGTTRHAALLVTVADKDGSPLPGDEHNHTIPFEALEGVEIL